MFICIKQKNKLSPIFSSWVKLGYRNLDNIDPQTDTHISYTDSREKLSKHFRHFSTGIRKKKQIKGT